MSTNDARELWAFWEELVACGDDVSNLLQLIARRAAEVVGEAAVLTVISDDGTLLEPVAVHHEDPALVEAMKAVLASSPYRIGEGIAGRVALERQPALLRAAAPSTIAELVQPHNRPFAEDHPIHALLIVPMVVAGELVGTLGVVRVTSTEPYGREDVLAVEALAERAARAIADVRHGTPTLAAPDFEAIYRHSIDGVILATPDGRILGANLAACEILELSEQAICSRGRSAVLVEDDPATVAAVAERQRTGRVRAELVLRRGNGLLFMAEVSSSIFTTSEGHLRTSFVFRDISEQVALREQLRRQTEALADQSERDHLTGLRNRRGFVEAARDTLALGTREHRPLQLLFFDLDNLKLVNDSQGHLAGDELLRRFGAAIAGETRRSDVSARLGGDEFVLLLYGATRNDAEVVIDRISTSGGEHVAPAFSVGVAEHDPDARTSLEDLLHRADRAMYDAKARRRFGSGWGTSGITER